MFSMIIEYISEIFYWFIGLIENVANDITMPKWIKIIIMILLASLFITVGAALIKLAVGIGMAILVILGVIATIFFVVTLIYAMIELIKNNFR